MSGGPADGNKQEFRARILEILGDESKLISYMQNAAHQMRTPMTLISSYTELILAEMYGPLAEDMKEKMETISSSLEELSYFVDQVQDIGYLSDRNSGPRIRSSDIASLVDSVISEISFTGKQRRVTVEFEKPKSPVNIAMDEYLARRALSHLLRYVVSTAPFGRRIRIALKEGKERVLVIVLGFGQIMDKDRMASIIREMSERDAKLTTMEWEKLSLPIAKALMEIQGGDLTIFEDEEERSVYVLEFVRDQTDDTIR